MVNKRRKEDRLMKIKSFIIQLIIIVYGIMRLLIERILLCGSSTKTCGNDSIGQVKKQIEKERLEIEKERLQIVKEKYSTGGTSKCNWIAMICIFRVSFLEKAKMCI